LPSAVPDFLATRGTTAGVRGQVCHRRNSVAVFGLASRQRPACEADGTSRTGIIAEEGTMAACIICRFEIELDDVAVRGSRAHRAICLRCYARETGTHQPMPKTLRREIQAALAGITVA
jgi:hypothetical protein